MMRILFSTILILIAYSAAHAQSDTEVNGSLEDECVVSILQLEESFITDEYDKGKFNPFSSSDEVMRMRMLIEMVSMCSQNGLLRRAQSRMAHTESTIQDPNTLDSVKEIDAEIKEINELLGRLHNQKKWFGAPGEIYVSG